MSQFHTGNIQPQMDAEEHDHPSGAQGAKRVSIRGLVSPTLSTATVGTSAVLLPTSELSQRRSTIVWNSNASLSMWIGDSSLASGTGIQLDPQEKMAIDVQKDLYGIAEANYILARILELR